MYFVADLTSFLEHSQLLVPEKLILFHIKLFCYITSCWTELNLFTAIDKQVLQLIIISLFEMDVSERYSSMWEEAEIPEKKPTYRTWGSRASHSGGSGEIIPVYIYNIMIFNIISSVNGQYTLKMFDCLNNGMTSQQ